jgi:hypothetical protein
MWSAGLAKTLLEQLESVQAAIEAVLSSQSYEMNGRKLTRADLEILYAREDRLEAKISRYGSDYIPGQNISARKGPVFKKAVYKC